MHKRTLVVVCIYGVWGGRQGNYDCSANGLSMLASADIFLKKQSKDLFV